MVLMKQMLVGSILFVACSEYDIKSQEDPENPVDTPKQKSKHMLRQIVPYPFLQSVRWRSMKNV